MQVAQKDVARKSSHRSLKEITVELCRYHTVTVAILTESPSNRCDRAARNRTWRAGARRDTRHSFGRLQHKKGCGLNAVHIPPDLKTFTTLASHHGRLEHHRHSLDSGKLLQGIQIEGRHFYSVDLIHTFVSQATTTSPQPCCSSHSLPCLQLAPTHFRKKRHAPPSLDRSSYPRGLQRTCRLTW